MTCDMIRRKTKEKRGSFMMCRACGNTFTRRHGGLKCRKCHAQACNAACARDVADLHCCCMSGFASHESPNQSCSQGLGSSAAEGTPRLTQRTEQATDVQMGDVQIADVQCECNPRANAWPTGLRSRGAYRQPPQIELNSFILCCLLERPC